MALPCHTQSLGDRGTIFLNDDISKDGLRSLRKTFLGCKLASSWERTTYILKEPGKNRQ